VSNRYCRNVDRPPCQQLLQPGSWRDILSEARPDDRSGPMDQQRAQIAVTAFADPADMLLAAAGMNSWRQPQPGCEVPCRLELPAVTDAGDDRTGRDRPYPRAEASRWLASEFLCQVTIRASIASIRLVNAST
jgi:hypothetical protein